MTSSTSGRSETKSSKRPGLWPREQRRRGLRLETVFQVEADPPEADARPAAHRDHCTTASYSHLADGQLVEAAERVGRLVAEVMDRGSNARRQ